jgi:uncharacterized protein involved in propanediol utilization
MKNTPCQQTTWADRHHEQGATVGTGRAFGSFGELMQGALPGGDREFLVTLPIAEWSTVTFHYSPRGQRICVWPPGKRKSKLMARLAIEAAGGCGGGLLEVRSSLPEGKGLASSSADLVATARAVAAALGGFFDESAIEALLRRIEPSDGVMYEGIVAFYHREVRLHSRLGTVPPLAVIGHDEGGEVDTISYNRQPKHFSAACKHEYRELLATLGDAIRLGDLREVGRVSTRSAVMNQELRRRGDLEYLRRVCADIDGLGLVAAHSGTMLGILVAVHDPECGAKARYVADVCADLGGAVTVFRSVSACDVGLETENAL